MLAASAEKEPKVKKNSPAKKPRHAATKQAPNLTPMATVNDFHVGFNAPESAIGHSNEYWVDVAPDLRTLGHSDPEPTRSQRDYRTLTCVHVA
jgi:hypothetical protein